MKDPDLLPHRVNSGVGMFARGTYCSTVLLCIVSSVCSVVRFRLPPLLLPPFVLFQPSFDDHSSPLAVLLNALRCFALYYWAQGRSRVLQLCVERYGRQSRREEEEKAETEAAARRRQQVLAPRKQRPPGAAPAREIRRPTSAIWPSKSSTPTPTTTSILCVAKDAQPQGEHGERVQDRSLDEWKHAFRDEFDTIIGER